MTSTYAEALARLLACPTTPKLGIERMTELLGRLGNPHLRPALHVAGTKGKGSTCAFADAILRAAGLRTGLTTSPHLSTARERIVVDGAMLDEPTFVALEQRVADASRDLPTSFFERTIAMAWLAFARADVDVAVVEVGLGGRLDATNVIAPLACAVTRLGLDHTEHLGPTLADIAREKAGILKRAVPAVSAPQASEARAVLEQRAAAAGAPLTFVAVDERLTPSLRGAHQQENASVAVALVQAAPSLAARISAEAVARGLASARWPGRYEALLDGAGGAGGGPYLVVDGAHNDTAARALVQTALADPRMRGRIALIVGMTGNRDAVAFGQALLPLAPAQVWAVPAPSPRTRDPQGLAADLTRAGLAGVAAASVADALGQARGGGADAVVVCGSLYVVGEVRHALLGGPRDPVMPAF